MYGYPEGNLDGAGTESLGAADIQKRKGRRKVQRAASAVVSDSLRLDTAETPGVH
jgi:hypothetical protein